MSWIKEYEDYVFRQALHESRKDIIKLNDETFDKYTDYVALVSTMSTDKGSWDAQHKIVENYNQAVEEYLKEMNKAKEHFNSLLQDFS